MKDFDFLKSELVKKVSNADLPTTYEYKLNKKIKNLTLRLLKSGLKANMQDNESAFESWAIALRFYLPEFITTVTIDWDDNIVGDLHFNRFVYRLAKFVQTYEWVRLSKKLPDIPTVLVCNCPNGVAAEQTAHTQDSEGWLECEFVRKKAKGYDAINHQLPVGLFAEEVSKTTHFTTGQKSAIDIWALKGKDFFIFELKKNGNNPLGIISELMFYTNVIQDLFSHRIQFESENAKVRKAIKENYRGFKEIYELYTRGNIEKINAVLLAEKFHPLITDGFIDFINDSARYKYCNIAFSIQSPQ